MTRFKAQISYFGQNYFGFQIQNQSPTIQEVLEEKIFQITREKTRIVPSGRTDAGVHALKQFIHFDLKTETAIERITKNDFVYKMNSVLPDDISLTTCTPCDKSFHARKSAKEKTYSYWILEAKNPHPFFHHLSWQLAYDLDHQAIKEASDLIIGEHDFSSFCAADSMAETKVRHLLKIELQTKALSEFFNFPETQWLQINFTGKGFLKQMVRNLVGTFVDIGRHKIPSNKIRTILEARNRQLAGPTAPPQGLYLVDVSY